MGIYARGRRLWIRYRDVGGKWRSAATPFDVGQEEQAQAVHDEVVRGVAAQERAQHASTRLTVRAFVADWLPKRRERGLDWRNDESRLKHHVLPELGDMVLADVRTRHLAELFHKLRTDRERDLAQRTIYN